MKSWPCMTSKTASAAKHFNILRHVSKISVQIDVSNSNGLPPKSHGLQPTSDGLQPKVGRVSHFAPLGVKTLGGAGGNEFGCLEMAFLPLGASGQAGSRDSNEEEQIWSKYLRCGATGTVRPLQEGLIWPFVGTCWHVTRVLLTCHMNCLRTIDHLFK